MAPPSHDHVLRFIGCAALLALWGCGLEDRSADQPGSPAAESRAPAESERAAESPGQAASADSSPGSDERAWTPLFDGHQLGGWRRSDFATQGEVTVQDEAIRIQAGDNCSGITWNTPADLPRCDYELQLQAMRVEGQDFFCGLTFPVNDKCCSLIVGGWGGGLVGLSCLDGYDASENSTSSWQTFDQGRWYTIRIRVVGDRISAWIDNLQVVDVALEGHEVSIRPEVHESQPLGIATWQTSAMIRRIQWRNILPSPNR